MTHFWQHKYQNKQTSKVDVRNVFENTTGFKKLGEKNKGLTQFIKQSSWNMYYWC